MFKLLRITVLMFILITVVAQAINANRQNDWEQAAWVSIYAISGDGSERSERYMRHIETGDFSPIERYLAQQAGKWKLELPEPVRLFPAGSIDSLPPSRSGTAGIVGNILYSLQLRWWAWRHRDDSQPADVHLFVVYHDPLNRPLLPHSLGLEKGRIGVVYAFAGNDYRSSNNIVITHELLHTLGATDKYDLATNQPLYPQGYASPDKSPLHPQKRAELMAGRIAISENQFSMPRGLGQTIVGEQTSREIGWIR